MRHPTVLSAGARERIRAFVGSHPGTHLREIARSLGLPLGTTLYHLDYLHQSNEVVVRRDGRYKRFFATNDLGRVEKDYVSALRHAVPCRIVTALLAGGRATQRGLSESIGVSRSTLSFHVNHLVDKGILVRRDAWPENEYAVADPALASRILARIDGASGPWP